MHAKGIIQTDGRDWTSFYWDGNNATVGTASSALENSVYGWTTTSTAHFTAAGGTEVVYDTNKKNDEKGKVNPLLVFKLIKKNKFSIIGRKRYERRMERLKKLSYVLLKMSHKALGGKFLDKIREETAMAEVSGAGVKFFVMKSLIDKYKHRIKGGHIADTLFSKYTKVIPKDVLLKKMEIDKTKVFDDYVIYHYWNEKLEEKREKKEAISPSEKAAMRDPILFGIRRDMPDRLFFIADWEDEYCDLTFTDLIDRLKLDDGEVEIPPASEINFDDLLKELKSDKQA